MSAWDPQFSGRGITVEASASIELGRVEARRHAARMARSMAGSRKLEMRNGESLPGDVSERSNAQIPKCCKVWKSDGAKHEFLSFPPATLSPMPAERTRNAANWPARPRAQAATGRCSTRRCQHSRAGSTAFLARDYA